jgi:uncharacterized protein (TIGR00106 family)
MLASFSMTPLGVGVELKQHIADVLRIVEESGLPFRLGAMQTTVEGEPEAVMSLIMRCHSRLMEAAPRVLTQISIDDRKGATGRLTGKVEDVERVLGRKLSRE